MVHIDPKGKTSKYTYEQLVKESNKFANVLKKLGVKKGDRVFIFLPRVPELYISFLGILKLGAIAGTLFAAFGTEALKDRLGNSEASIVITHSSLKDRITQVRPDLPALKHVIISDEKKVAEDELSYSKLMKPASDRFSIVKTSAEDPAFMLYTSGTTGKPKGVVHCHNSIIHQYATTKWILDLHEKDVYWCTADPGWVTGIAYGILGPMANGVTSIVYQGRFSPEEWFKLIQKYKISMLYTAPTAIRLLMREDPAMMKKYNLSSLRHLCSVGEPLNPEAIKWGVEVLGLPFHDNWWQTETGGILIANYPRMKIKSGSMGRPFPGVTAAIIDDRGKELPPGTEGNLAIKPGWPSMMRAVWGNKKKYDSYFKKGWYITGDKARMDEEGFFWFIGRADDVINTAGHRVGPFEVESSLVEHPAVAEAGVIGKPDELMGEIIKAFVTLKKGFKPSEKLKQEIVTFIKRHHAGHAYPREIEFRKNLPKTRSGKIMRRLLKAEELGLDLGDTSTVVRD
jgi:acetyl-CoA synthetase